MSTFRSSWFLAALLLALAGTPLSADGSALADLPPFVDSVLYSVPGTLLNQWMKDSQKQDADLRAALAQVRISQESFALYKSKVAQGEILIGIGGFIAGTLFEFLVNP